jgi:hypothetical protein
LIPVTITPLDGLHDTSLLEWNRNGRLTFAVTEDYAQTMRDAEWKAGSVLIFCENYKIIDGYYRLAAVASVRSASGILSSPRSA